MSSFSVNVFAIKVEPHPDPETTALECARIGDYRVVVKKGAYQDGDKVAYMPQDSVLPENLIKELGLEGRLAGARQNRVKAIKLRGQLSQGLVYPMPAEEIGADVTAKLGITKYEPPIPTSMSGVAVAASGKTLKYDIESLKRYPDVLQPGQAVVMTEKIHGTWTCLGLYEGEPVVTSKGLSAKGLVFSPDNEQNLYWQQYLVSKEKIGELSERLQSSTFYVLGETYGYGVQDMQYGLKERQFKVFDIYVGKPGEGSYLDYPDLMKHIEGLFEAVPVVYVGEYDKQLAYKSANAEKSTLADCIREGVVIKPLAEKYDHNLGRVILKVKSDAYETRKQGTEYN